MNKGINKKYYYSSGGYSPINSRGYSPILSCLI